MAARRAVPRVVEEDHPQLRARVLRVGDETAVHVGVPARLEDQQLPDMVEVFERIAPLLEDGGAAQRWHTAADDPERLAGGMVVDGTDHEVAARRRCAHQLILPEPGGSRPPPRSRSRSRPTTKTPYDFWFRQSMTSLVSATVSSRV